MMLSWNLIVQVYGIIHVYSAHSPQLKFGAAALEWMFSGDDGDGDSGDIEIVMVVVMIITVVVVWWYCEDGDCDKQVST